LRGKQAGWKCDDCRKLGLEKKRNCGWLGAGDGRVVWLAGRDVTTTECPVSYLTGESVAFLEDFYANEAIGGGGSVWQWPARKVEAFVVLRAEQRKAEAGRRA
jgi:hypothetical protein